MRFGLVLASGAWYTGAMKSGRSISLSALVLVVGGMLALVAASFAVNLAPSYFAGGVAAILAGAFLLLITLFLFWVVRELEENEERLRVIVESAHDGIITADEQGYIERVNTSTVSMFGYRPGNIIGEHVSVLLSSAYGERVEDEGLEAYLEREGLNAKGVPCEVRGLRRDGQTFYMDISITRARLDDEYVYTIMVRDVTERVAAQRVLREARDELERRVEERTAALKESNEKLESEAAQRLALIDELQQALSEIKTLSGLLPICSSCKKIRDDSGYWNQIEVYIRDNSDAEFSHGICPQCMKELYPDITIPSSES